MRLFDPIYFLLFVHSSFIFLFFHIFPFIYLFLAHFHRHPYISSLRGRGLSFPIDLFHKAKPAATTGSLNDKTKPRQSIHSSREAETSAAGKNSQTENSVHKRNSRNGGHPDGNSVESSISFGEKATRSLPEKTVPDENSCSGGVERAEVAPPVGKVMKYSSTRNARRNATAGPALQGRRNLNRECRKKNMHLMPIPATLDIRFHLRFFLWWRGGGGVGWDSATILENTRREWRW